MSLEQLDDSEFLSHVAWLAEQRRPFSTDAVARLKTLADTGNRRADHAREQGYGVGLSDGYAESRREAPDLTTSHMPGDDLDIREAGEPPVLVVMSRRAATEASGGLSDLLCWCRGFVAASPEDLDRHPMSWEVAREIRIALQRAIEASE